MQSFDEGKTIHNRVDSSNIVERQLAHVYIDDGCRGMVFAIRRIDNKGGLSPQGIGPMLSCSPAPRELGRLEHRGGVQFILRNPLLSHSAPDNLSAVDCWDVGKLRPDRAFLGWSAQARTRVCYHMSV